jgi:bifunctional enzyme CysN/CysC
MATGASNADLAILLVDARKGLLVQTRRHAFIVSLLGIRHLILAVNKMDLVDYDERRFDEIVAAFGAFAGHLGFASISAIPISARHGDNVSNNSARTPWYEGRPLVEQLERVDIGHQESNKPFRFPVQLVLRPDLDFRGLAGTVASGRVAVGDEVLVAGSGHTSRVREIISPAGSAAAAQAGDAICLTLETEIDATRGDVIAAPADPPVVADHFRATVIWMSESQLQPNRSYLMKIGTRVVPASVTELRHRVDVNTQEHLAAKTLAMNEIGVCNIATSAPIALDGYAANSKTGSFILIDRLTDETAGAGMIEFALHRGQTLFPHQTAVTKNARAQLKHQRPCILWFTGLSGAGKSTIANLVEVKLHGRGVHTAMLDGDNVRKGLNRDLGFTESDRVENIRRAGEAARLMTEAGLVVLCSFISPYAAERNVVRELVPPGEFVEIFVDAPVETCIERDPKGLYRRALAGEIANFTGISHPYEPPPNPELILDTGSSAPGLLADAVVGWMEGNGLIQRLESRIGDRAGEADARLVDRADVLIHLEPRSVLRGRAIT